MKKLYRLFVFGLLLCPLNAAAQTLNWEPYPERLDVPDISWENIDGEKLTPDDFKGKVILLNFWATWCGPCALEMPDLDRLQGRYKKAGLEVVAVSIDDGLVPIGNFFNRHNLRNLEPYIDKTTEAPGKMGVTALPMTFLIDREGKLVGMVSGYAEWMAPSARRIIEAELRKGFTPDKKEAFKAPKEQEIIDRHSPSQMYQ